VATTIGGGGVAETTCFGASQVPVGTRAAAAVLPTVVVRTVEPCADGITAEGRGAEGTGGCGGAGPAALRMAAISTLPTGV
jgi:hypothetical protein